MLAICGVSRCSGCWASPSALPQRFVCAEPFESFALAMRPPPDNRLSSLLEHDQPADGVWAAATASPKTDLGLTLVRVVDSEPVGIPLIGRPTGAVDDATFELPQCGAAIRLGRRWLVLTPRNGMGPVTLDRAAVATFAATVDLALASSPAAVS